MALTVGIVEAVSALLLKAGYQRSADTSNDTKNLPYSAYEIPESFSEFPKAEHPDHSFHPFTNKVTGAWSQEPGVWRPPNNYSGEGQVVDKITGEVKWRFRVHTDAHGRRYPRWQPDREKTATSHYVLMGCSNTWGESVDDEDIFGAQFSKDDPSSIAYTLAFSGYSVGEVLARARLLDGLKDINPKRGVGVYIMFDEHIQRLLNSAFIAGRWRPDGVELHETSPGQFEILGLVSDVRPFWSRFARIWGQSKFAELINRDIPAVTPHRIDYFFRVVKALRDEYHRNTDPRNPFIVVLLPYRTRAVQLRQGLDRAQIPFLDYTRTEIPSLVNGISHQPGEVHPKPEVYALIAKAMKRDIKRYLEVQNRKASNE